jgi:spermidine/putrescine-binding protein
MKHQLILVAGAAALASFMPFSSLAAEGAQVVATNVAYYSDAAMATEV